MGSIKSAINSKGRKPVSNSALASAIEGVEEVVGGYAPGYKLVHGTVPNAVEPFMVISSGGAPRLLLPPSQRAMRVALSRFLGNRPWIGMVPPLVHLAAKQRIVSSRVSAMSLTSPNGEPSALRKFLGSVLGREDFYLALRISFGRPNAKTVVLAISHDGDALCFAKIGSEQMTNNLVRYEGNILGRLEKVDLPIVTPSMLYGDVWKRERHILITKPLQLKPLPVDAHLAHRAADLFTAAHPITSCSLRDSEYWRQTTSRIKELDDATDQHEALHTALTRIDKSWGSTLFDFGASHGDWSRANLGIVDGRVAAFDWERFSEHSPRGIDIAHFAICEFTRQRVRPRLDIKKVAEKTRHYLTDAGRPKETAELLVIFDCLEMLIRFMSAQKAGVKSDDSTFTQALSDGLQAWAN